MHRRYQGPESVLKALFRTSVARIAVASRVWSPYASRSVDFCVAGGLEFSLGLRLRDFTVRQLAECDIKSCIRGYD